MAFKMTRPMIKGSALHKEAKSVVSGSRTAADPTLVAMADEYGKSGLPGAIEYGVKYAPDLKQRRMVKRPSDYKDLDRQSAAEQYTVNYDDMILNENGEWVPKDGAVSNKYGDTWSSEEGWLDDGDPVYYDSEGNPINEEEYNRLGQYTTPEEESSDALNTSEFVGNPGDPYTYRVVNGEYQYKKGNNDWKTATTQGAIDAIKAITPPTVNPVQKRKINKNQRKLVKRGFNPYKS
tara:strand:+ start:1545 stop:2249 length:705 start_codon:yes stop_codon:yes gene_type:complete